jgi:hypothetical protein
MLATPLISVEIPDSVLSNPWMKGIFGQMLRCLPSEITNRWHASAAKAAWNKELLFKPAKFTANILYNIALDESAPKTPGDHMQAVRRKLAELLILLSKPNAELYSLEQIQRATTAMALHGRSLPADTALLLALNAAVGDAIEMRKWRDTREVSPHRFGQTVFHACNVIAWRTVYRQKPLPTVGFAQDRAVELERETACVGFGQLLIEYLQESPEIMPGDASDVS